MVNKEKSREKRELKNSNIMKANQQSQPSFEKVSKTIPSCRIKLADPVKGKPKKSKDKIKANSPKKTKQAQLHSKPKPLKKPKK